MNGEVVALETELPEGERRERLLQALARVIALRGYETFINAPILRPSAEYFPEPVERTLRGAGVLVLRLLRYAKLNPLPVLLTGYQNRAGHVAEGISLHDPQLKAAAWYAGIQEGVCHFGLELRGLRDDSALLAALAHEVTHAYRDRHSLAVRDRDAEEKLTDLTAVYLGFGVFLANASHRVETGGYSEGGRLSYERHSLGYLSPAEFALLLAAQVVTRGNRESERRKVRGALSPNHARLFELGVQELAGDAVSLCHQLGIPESEQWPEAAPLEITELDLDELEIVEPQAASESEPSGSLSFRVEQSQALFLGVLGGLLGFALGALLELSGGALLGLCALGLALGVLVGVKRRQEWCSSCRGRLQPSAQQCEKCGARVVGEIESFNERLEAEEEFLKAEAARRKKERAAQSQPQARSSARNQLENALFMAWVLTSGLTRTKRSPTLEALIADVQAGNVDVARLLEGWDLDPQPFSKEGHEFAAYYISNHQLRRRDLGILSTANTIRADRGTLLRFSAILDRRLIEWRAREGDTPSHQL